MSRCSLIILLFQHGPWSPFPLVTCQQSSASIGIGFLWLFFTSNISITTFFAQQYPHKTQQNTTLGRKPVSTILGQDPVSSDPELISYTYANWRCCLPLNNRSLNCCVFMDLDVPYGFLINIILIKSLFDWIDKVERQLVNAGCPRNSEKKVITLLT